MNWKQLYSSATPEERLALLVVMMQVIEARPQRVVFTGQRWVRDRRQGYQAHFLNNRRGSRHSFRRSVGLLTFGIVLVTVSAATWAFALSVPLQFGGPALFFHVTALLGVLAFKPYNLRRVSAL